MYARAEFARSFSVSVVWIFENSPWCAVRFCYSRDVTNVQKRRNECSCVLVDRTNSLRDETGCFWRDMCAYGEKYSRARVYCGEDFENF